MFSTWMVLKLLSSSHDEKLKEWTLWKTKHSSDIEKIEFSSKGKDDLHSFDIEKIKFNQ